MQLVEEIYIAVRDRERGLSYQPSLSSLSLPIMSYAERSYLDPSSKSGSESTSQRVTWKEHAHIIARMTTEEKFQAAINIIRSLPKDGPYQPSHDMMLKFYGLYKQAVEGPCTKPKPAFYEVVRGYKWQAWHSLGSMSKAEAKNSYVEELKKIIETMAYTENVANFIDTLGPFYEYVAIPGKKKLNNNTAKGPPSRGDLSDSGNEVTDSSGGSGNSSPIPNGVDCEGRLDTATPQPLQNNVSGMEEDEASQEEEEEEEEVEEDEVEGEEEEEEDLQVGEPGNQVPAAGVAAAAVHKVFSDSDSDEEYSEPAEYLAHLSLDPRPSSPTHHHHHHHLTSTLSSTFNTTQQLNANSTDQEEPSSLHSLPHPTEVQDGAVTHGGGTKSHPGGLQMTPGQIMQGYGHSVRQTITPHSLPIPFHPTQSPWGAGGGAGGGGGRGGRGGGGRGASRVEDDVSAQLVVVLRRLQTDMESVLHRLNTLETLTLTQHHAVCRQCQGNSSSSSTTMPNSSGHSWWPFPELSPRSTFFLLVWPLFLHVGLRLLPLLRCRRKRT